MRLRHAPDCNATSKPIGKGTRRELYPEPIAVLCNCGLMALIGFPLDLIKRHDRDAIGKCGCIACQDAARALLKAGVAA